MDVVDAGPDLAGILVVAEDVEQLHPRTRSLDRDHVRVQARDVLDHLAELRVTHVRVDLRFRRGPCDGETEAVDRPAHIVVLVRLAQRQAFAQGRLVDLDDRGAGGLEV